MHESTQGRQSLSTGWRGRGIRTLLVAMSLGCTNVIGNDENGQQTTFDALPILVTSRHEEGFTAPSNGTVALLPMLQWDGFEPTTGTVVVQTISATGNRIGSPVNLGTNAVDVPVADWDGTNFLVVYQLTTTGGTDVYGQFFAPTGSASSAAFPITTTHDTPVPWSVTYGGGTHLVTYHRPVGSVIQAFAKTVSPTGTVGAEIPVNDLGGMSAAAFDGAKFLVAYARSRTEVWGRFIQPNGTIEAAFMIDGSAGASNGQMAMAFNGTNYLVVFGDSSSTTGWNVVSQAVAPAGTLVGGAAVIDGSAGDQLPRGIIADGGNFLITWHGPTEPYATFARFVDGSGVPHVTTRTLFLPSPGSTLATITSKLNGSYFAVINRRANSWDVFGKFMTITP